MIGLRHGWNCALCCWATMMLMFVLGETNLLWMVALTAFCLIKKVFPPGFKKLRYRVTIESQAQEETVRELIEKADAHSPVLDDFKRPIPIEREVNITLTKAKTL